MKMGHQLLLQETLIFYPWNSAFICQVIFPLTNIITTNIFIKQDNYYCNSFMQNTCVDSVTLHQRQTETKAKKTNWSTTKPEQPLKITNLNILSLNIHFFGHKNLNSFLFNLK